MNKNISHKEVFRRFLSMSLHPGRISYEHLFNFFWEKNIESLVNDYNIDYNIAFEYINTVKYIQKGYKYWNPMFKYIASEYYIDEGNIGNPLRTLIMLAEIPAIKNHFNITSKNINYWKKFVDKIDRFSQHTSPQIYEISCSASS